MEKDTRQYMIDLVIGKIKKELDRAESLHGAFHSLHEAIAIIREEYRELEDAVFWGVQKTGSIDGIRSEAIQTAAMCIRLAMMVTQPPREAYDRQVGPRTEMERRLLDMLKLYVDPQTPHFCEVCYAETKDSPNDCPGCPFRDRWIKALALIKECETKIFSPHVQE